MKKYWFKNKSFGYGWTPATWEGWVVMAVYALCLFGGVLFLGSDVVERDLVNLFFFIGALTFLLLVIVWRTGEPLRLRFNGKDVFLKKKNK